MFEPEKTVVYIGSDHLGWKLKNELKDFFNAQKFHFIDLGCFDGGTCSFEEIAREVAEKVFESGSGRGILLAGNGEDACQVAAAYKGIKAFCANTEGEVLKSGYNILGMNPAKVDAESAKKIISKFLA